MSKKSAEDLEKYRRALRKSIEGLPGAKELADRLNYNLLNNVDDDRHLEPSTGERALQKKIREGRASLIRQ